MLDPGDGTTYCHGIAKSQQAVEKAIKALVTALGMPVGWQHPVEPFLSVLIRYGRTGGGRDLRGLISRTFGEATRAGIRDLDRLVPRRPAPGDEPSRNTEYPYRLDGSWRAPAEAGSFARSEVERFYGLAHAVVTGGAKLLSLAERDGR